MIPQENFNIIFYDSIFPNPVSGFRYVEFSEYLKYFKKSKIFLSSDDYRFLKLDVGLHSKDIETFYKLFPEHRAQIDKTDLRKIKISANLFYCVFLNNIYKKISYLEKNNIPFVFTLYPGGGFSTRSYWKRYKLKRVLKSPMFRGVIVTQKFTKEFLISEKLCDESKICYIFGCIVPQNSISIPRTSIFGIDKDKLDICFCAAKYMPKGLDKGYDLFIASAKKLAKKFDFIHFHVIGGFNECDLDVTELKDRITFYGYKKFEELSSLFQNQDIIISPNRPFVLGKGSFDGFPLGAIVEAALNGVIPFVTDELNQNEGIFNEEELKIIRPDVDDICSKVEQLIENKERFKEFSLSTQKKFSMIFGLEEQLGKRVDFIKKNLPEE